MQKHFFLPALLLFCHFLSAQNPSRITIKGIVVDSTGEEIVMPTVMLLNPTDSALVNFTRGDDKGVFQLKNVKNEPYLLKISYVGYLPLQVRIEPSASAVHDLGELTIKPITSELLEVVVKAAKATLSIRGDTIEYDASSFKVPPGSTVEDLLRRLPGIEVDADGNIKAQGRDVRRVYVDGKTFFGDDPKAATKNLGAETLSKVQVYNEASEQSRLTGVDDGKREKAMNLELKEEFKKGSFGKITGAVGTEERWAARGNYNRFNQKEQLSFIGYGNNINQTGVNWEDYGEFKGQSSFSDFDNGDFGFNSGGGRIFYFGGGDDSPLNNFDGRGFTENFGGGANYNFDNKKTKLNTSYFYNQTKLFLDQFTDRQTFVEGNSFFNADTTTKVELRQNHSLNTRFEKDLDSNNLLIVKANGRFSLNDATTRQSQLFYLEDGTTTNRLSMDNGNDLNSWRVNSAAIFRHRFKKKGRSLAASAGFNLNQTDASEQLFSLNQFFNAGSFTEQIRQMNANDTRVMQAKSSLLFTEPLSKKWYWETFYNFSTTQNEVDRQVADPENSGQRIDSLSIYYDYDILYNRLGSSIRFSNEGLNVSVGVAAQQLDLRGEYFRARNTPLLVPPIDRQFLNVIPNVDLSYELKGAGRTWLNLGYGYSVREPQPNDLQPVPNQNNPLFRTEGNPGLDPERNHSFNLNINNWNPASLSNVGIGANFDLFDSQIVYNQTIEAIDSIGIRTTSRPENLSGGQRLNTYLWSNFPIVKTKLTMNLNGSLNFSNTPSFVNGQENETRNRGYRLNAGFNFTPGTKLILSAGGSINPNNITYSISREQNQKIRNYGVNAATKWQFADKFFLESNFSYNIYRNDRFNFNQDVPIWNASVRRLLGKENRLEVRLAAFDLLNRRVSITQNGTQNFVTRNIAPTLARYFMLSVSYNVRGYENKLNKNNWW
ncbi:MAG: TonB-dependent receptor [Saprospiraceae bacterium]|nr:TonB-dependent receptor [Saprospiraceae bacterium]